MALRELTPAKCRLLRLRSSYWCHRLLSSLRDLPIGTAADPFMGQKRIVEKRWMEFFSDPSQWWDHRTAKVTASYPDFTHKKTQAALWLDGRLKPPWVEARLVAMAPRTGQKALELYQQMQHEGVKPGPLTFVGLLNACAALSVLEDGKRVHEQTIQSGSGHSS
ncbi:unnamed protein product [Sphagnum troendelagicum]|uniref:Uncharacterized protein n=1 Tax=Sphagnum jensenii TaxID=128206 RepID=A0ABP0WRQ1_9BRYO